MGELADRHPFFARRTLNCPGIPQTRSNVNANHRTAPKWHRPRHKAGATEPESWGEGRIPQLCSN